MISVVTLISIDAAELVTGHIGGSFVAVAAGDDIDYTSCYLLLHRIGLEIVLSLSKSNAMQSLY